jgi:hypothetical protein
MREILGMPKRLLGASLGFPFWSVLFQYDSFPVTYESGLNNVPIFDVHIEVYSQDKIVWVNYDTPYVKGLPVPMEMDIRSASLGRLMRIRTRWNFWLSMIVRLAAGLLSISVWNKIIRMELFHTPYPYPYS